MNTSAQQKLNTVNERIAQAETANLAQMEFVENDAKSIGFEEDAARRIAEVWLSVKSRHDIVNPK